MSSSTSSRRRRRHPRRVGVAPPREGPRSRPARLVERVEAVRLLCRPSRRRGDPARRARVGAARASGGSGSAGLGSSGDREPCPAPAHGAPARGGSSEEWLLGHRRRLYRLGLDHLGRLDGGRRRQVLVVRVRAPLPLPRAFPWAAAGSASSSAARAASSCCCATSRRAGRAPLPPGAGAPPLPLRACASARDAPLWHRRVRPSGATLPRSGGRLSARHASPLHAVLAPGLCRVSTASAAAMSSFRSYAFSGTDATPKLAVTWSGPRRPPAGCGDSPSPRAFARPAGAAPPASVCGSTAASSSPP